MYLINIVSSEGYDNGRETRVIAGESKAEVIERAYKVYEEIFIEEFSGMPKTQKEAFMKEIEAGFEDGGYVVLQLIGSHYQFEPYNLCEWKG